MNDWPVMLQVAVTGFALVACIGLILGVLIVGWWIAEMTAKMTRTAEGE